MSRYEIAVAVICGATLLFQIYIILHYHNRK